MTARFARRLKNVAPILAASGILAACATQTVQHETLPGEPAGIAGLESGQLKTVFGQPAFARSEGAYEVWRYDGKSCKGFFFLYRESGGLIVRHVETTPRGAVMAADLNCLETLKPHAAPAVS